jgi:hypothetical protein
VRTITVAVEFPWPKGRPTLAKLERATHRAAMAAGRKALVEALRTWEADLLPTAGARQRRVRRYLLTRLGPIRFHRWKTRQDGRYGFPLDRAMRLRQWQACSWFVWERASRLGAEFPFRRAARLLSDLVGGPVDHRVLWRLVQRAGALRRAQQERARTEMFDQGLAPPEPEGDPPHMVVTEIDGVVLRRQRPRGVMEARLAVAYTGKRVLSPTARHPKRVVTGKVVVAGLWEEGTAGQVIYAWLSRSVGVHRARHRLVSGDGAEWIPVLVRNWFPDALFQLDHYHLKVRLRHVAGDPERASRWIAWTLGGQWHRVKRSMVHLVARGRLDSEVARETRAFLELNAPAIWAFRQLRRRGAPAELCTRGSGVVEHGVDLQVARRMKRQGMFWSREGANNMLALRAVLADASAWRAWWKEVSA